jgi:pyrrolidone-carboxylate peptidase
LPDSLGLFPNKLKILLTAFGPFSNFKRNPSEGIMLNLYDRLTNCYPEFTFSKKILAVRFESVNQFVETMDQHYDFIFHLGVARKSPSIRIELEAKNLVKGEDIDGNRKEGKIKDNEFKSFRTEEWLNKIVSEFNQKSEWIKESFNAGSYLCNYLYYNSMLNFGEFSSILFIHVSDFENEKSAPDLSVQSSEIYNLIERLIEKKSIIDGTKIPLN